MGVSWLSIINKTIRMRLFVLLVTVAAFSFNGAAQRAGGLMVPEVVGFRLEQCANGARTVPQLDDPCDAGSDWITGDVNHQKGHYTEGDSMPYRLIMNGLQPGVATYVTFRWDTTKKGKHAFDYITGYDRTENAANNSQAEPCAGLGLTICPVGDLDGS